MTEGSGTPFECPDCGYETRVWDEDGHTDECPDCARGELMPSVAADAVRRDRLKRSPSVQTALDAGDATDAILAPEGSTDPDRVTHIDGMPVVESVSLSHQPDSAIAVDLDGIYEMGSRLPVDHEAEAIAEGDPDDRADAVRLGHDPETYVGSLSIELDGDDADDQAIIDAIRDAAEEARQDIGRSLREDGRR